MIKNPLLEQLSQRDVLSVTELNHFAKKILEKNLSNIWIEGEISNFSKPASGHWYFTLKDNNAQIRCVMFKKNNQSVKFSIDQGVKIIARANISLYETRGDYQLIAEHLELAGIGDLQKAYEALKTKLEKAGLFAAEHKQKLPKNPAHIGIITSPSGAAIKDILSVLARRQPNMRITLYPVSVQGMMASGEIVRAIEFANRIAQRFQTPLQALIVGRGGGSLEDLWPFNEENVANAIYNSQLPVISAVGHEIDFSISDFVADCRAPTPSAAAEIISDDQQEQTAQLLGYEQWFIETIKQRIRHAQLTLHSLQKRLRHPRHQLQHYAQRLDDIELRMQQAIKHTISNAQNALQLQHLKLDQQQPLIKIQQHSLTLTQIRHSLTKLMDNQLNQRRNTFTQQTQLLQSLSPLAILGRGYSLSRTTGGNVISDVNSLSIGDSVITDLAHGRFSSTVDTIDAENNRES